MPIAKKSFGQHFLHDKAAIEKIASSLSLEGLDAVVEVGPGTGVLTRVLAGKVPVPTKLVLVEADRDLISALRQEFPQAEIVQGDAARVPFSKYVGERARWALFGNLPYNAAAAILENALSTDHLPESAVIMVQKEQGDRMLAAPGNMSLLSVVVQLAMEGKRVMKIGPGAFSPPPKIDSLVLRLDRRAGVLSAEEREKVIQLAKVGFSSRRKQLHNNLVRVGVGSKADVERAIASIGKPFSVRPQELSVEDWVRLFEAFNM